MKTIGQLLSGNMRAGIFLLALVFSSGVGLAAEPDTGAERALLDKYAAIRPKLDKNQFGAPIYLESSESDKTVRVDMYGVVGFAFEKVKEALQDPANWCEITPLHINIKACTYRTATDPPKVTLYSGRKYYQPPSDAYPIRYTFRTVSSRPDFLELNLDADEGPLGTRNHRMMVQALPLERGATLLRFSYIYSQGAAARLAIKGYFSTIGRDKVGFTVIGTEGGSPKYIEGVRGAVERNTMRYYLALQTFLETLAYPEGQAFEKRIGLWYDLTARYPRQLREIDKNSYLANKRKEHAKQLSLQKKEGN